MRTLEDYCDGPMAGDTRNKLQGGSGREGERNPGDAEAVEGVDGKASRVLVAGSQ